MSHASMALGSVSIDDSGCDLFEANFSSMLDTAFATIAAVSAGKSKGISTEHLSKVWSIPHEAAARILQVTTQRLRHDADSSLSRNFGKNDRAVRYKKLKSYFFSDTLFVTIFLPLSSPPLSRRSSSDSATFSSAPNFALLSQTHCRLYYLATLSLHKKSHLLQPTTNIIKTPLLIMVNTICLVSILVKLWNPGNANGNITTPNFQHVTMRP